MALLDGRTLIVVDTETTGFDPLQGHEIIEVATVAIENGAISAEWASLVRPSHRIPREVAAALRLRCGDHVLAFHNALFDLPFVRALLRGAGKPPLTAPVIDTLGLARGLFGAGGNSLASLAPKLALPVETAHRALPDARTTARALLQLVPRWERERGAGSLDELAAASLDQVRLSRRSRVGGPTAGAVSSPAGPAPAPAPGAPG